MTHKSPASPKRQYKYSASDEEQAQIRRAARGAGLSVSAYVLEAALGRPSGVSAEAFTSGLGILEKAQKELQHIADHASDDADGLRLLTKLGQLETTIRLLASVKEFEL